MSQSLQECAPIVNIRNLSHRHSKDGAVREVSFDTPESGTVCFFGSRGVSKSTRINIMCGVLFTTEGAVLIEGCRRFSAIVVNGWNSVISKPAGIQGTQAILGSQICDPITFWKYPRVSIGEDYAAYGN